MLWLFCPAWDAVELTLQVGFICSFVVIDPTDLGATIVVATPRDRGPRRKSGASSLAGQQTTQTLNGLGYVAGKRQAEAGAAGPRGAGPDRGAELREQARGRQLEGVKQTDSDNGARAVYDARAARQWREETRPGERLTRR